jgi:hypothetical protein
MVALAERPVNTLPDRTVEPSAAAQTALAAASGLDRVVSPARKRLAAPI